MATNWWLTSPAASRASRRRSATFATARREQTVTIADRSKLFAARLGEDQRGAARTHSPGKQVRFDRAQHYAGYGRALGCSRTARAWWCRTSSPARFADDIGLNRGDVILEINKQPVNQRDDFRRIAGHAEERAGCGLPGPSSAARGDRVARSLSQVHFRNLTMPNRHWHWAPRFRDDFQCRCLTAYSLTTLRGAGLIPI